MSTGLIPMPRIDPRDRIIADLRTENERLKQDLATARQDVSDERVRSTGIERGVSQLREILSPLYAGLGSVFGELESMGVEAATATPTARTSAVWESWKAKLSGTAAKAIDALLLHGSMTAEQLRIHLGCATRTCYNIIGELNRAKLIDKNGGRISLKQL